MSQDLVVSEHDNVEHLDVLIVGAGLAGIGAAHHVQADLPGASFAIFEARDAMGGRTRDVGEPTRAQPWDRAPT